MSIEKKRIIIEAAYNLLSQKGYDQASTKEIAKEAGVAQGLINYYFENKDQLYIEVVKSASEKYCSMMDQMMISNEAMNQEALAGMLKDRIINNSELYRLKYELYAMGLRNPALTHEVKENLNASKERIERFLSGFFGKGSVEIKPLAAITFSALEGMAMQKIIDPDFDIDESYKVLYEMLKGYIMR